jgi:fructose-bisphosphate aldolase class 1
MNTQELTDTAQALVADDKGLLAMDESNSDLQQKILQNWGFPRPRKPGAPGGS